MCWVCSLCGLYSAPYGTDGRCLVITVTARNCCGHIGLFHVPGNGCNDSHVSSSQASPEHLEDIHFSTRRNSHSQKQWDKNTHPDSWNNHLKAAKVSDPAVLFPLLNLRHQPCNLDRPVTGTEMWKSGMYIYTHRWPLCLTTSKHACTRAIMRVAAS